MVNIFKELMLPRREHAPTSHGSGTAEAGQGAMATLDPDANGQVPDQRPIRLRGRGENISILAGGSTSTRANAIRRQHREALAEASNVGNRVVRNRRDISSIIPRDAEDGPQIPIDAPRVERLQASEESIFGNHTVDWDSLARRNGNFREYFRKAYVLDKKPRRQNDSGPRAGGISDGEIDNDSILDVGDGRTQTETHHLSRNTIFKSSTTSSLPVSQNHDFAVGARFMDSRSLDCTMTRSIRTREITGLVKPEEQDGLGESKQKLTPLAPLPSLERGSKTHQAPDGEAPASSTPHSSYSEETRGGAAQDPVNPQSNLCPHETDHTGDVSFTTPKCQTHISLPQARLSRLDNVDKASTSTPEPQTKSSANSHGSRSLFTPNSGG